MLSLIKGPYLQWPTQESITIVWETSHEASSEVLFWRTEQVHCGLNGRPRTIEASGQSVQQAGPACIHAITLTGLDPSTTYHYRVKSADAAGNVTTSDEYPLKTAVLPDEPFSFAVTSETGGYGDDAINRRLFPQIARHRPDFLLVVGDAVAKGSLYEEWGRWFFDPGRPLLAHTPFYLCLGNHEEKSPWFYRFVAYPEPKNYYAFDYGNARFVAIDSTAGLIYKDRRPVAVAGEAGFGPGSAQYAFVESALQTASVTWKFVFFHYPPYVSSDYQVEEMRVLCPLFERYGVDVVFNSHAILYERSHPIRAGRLDLRAGVRYIVAGGAGSKPEWFHPKRAWHTAQSLAVPHFVQASIAGPTLELRAIDDEGRLFDTLTLSK